MEEFFVNKYVVETTYGHPGSTTYSIYSTPVDMAALVQALSDSLQKSPDERQKHWYAPDVLWRAYATTAGGSTSRVYLTFRLADDLARFHVRPAFARRLRGWVRFACWLVLIAFAGIGVCATASGFIRLGVVTQFVLFGVSVVGLAVALLWLQDRIAESRAHRT